MPNIPVATTPAASAGDCHLLSTLDILCQAAGISYHIKYLLCAKYYYNCTILEMRKTEVQRGQANC